VIGLDARQRVRRLGRKSPCWRRCRIFSRPRRAVAKEAWKIFVKEQGLEIKLGVKIAMSAAASAASRVEYETGEGKQALDCSKLVVSVGRVPTRATWAPRRWN